MNRQFATPFGFAPFGGPFGFGFPHGFAFEEEIFGFAPFGFPFFGFGSDFGDDDLNKIAALLPFLLVPLLID
ncbi:hypothetical protein BSNK01_13090 [Bacillaceae bacterium]